VGAESKDPRVLGLDSSLEGTLIAAPRSAPQTDVYGRIALTVPSQAELVVHLAEEQSRAWSAERVENGTLRQNTSPARLVLAPGEKGILRSEGGRPVLVPRGDPIVLAPGETRELRFELGRTLAVTGIVRFPDRSPVPGARLRVFDGSPARFGAFESRWNAWADPQGRFGFVLHDLASDSPVSIVAADGEWVAMGEGGIEHAKALSFAPAEWRIGMLDVELVLDRTLDLSGRVVDERGEPFDGVIWAIPAYADFLLQKDELGVLPISFLVGKGSFVVKGLPPGTYDIVVKRNRPRTYHRFDGFQAGSVGIELQIVDDRTVNVRLRVEGGAGEVSVQPVLLKHQYREARSSSPLDATAAIRLEGGEPLGVRSDTGSWNQEDLEGRTIQLVEEPSSARSHAFEPQQPGWYTVGLRAWDDEGHAFAPRFSEPVRLEGGDYEFVAHLVR
jgi:hypothetical protein